MKKILISLSALLLMALAITPLAMEAYYRGDPYYSNNYQNNAVGEYHYDYSADYYGPMPYYSATRPVYRVTSSYDPNVYVDPVYAPSVYAPGAVAQLPGAYNYNYNYDYSYSYQNAPYYGPASYSAQKFVDVSPSDPNFAAIQWIGLNNIAGGFDGGRYFRPTRNVTRAEFVAMVVKGAKADPSEQSYHHCYSDVGTEWFANEVCYARAQGWLPLNYVSRFNPSQAVTTSEARTILSRAYNVTPSMPAGSNLTRGDAAAVLYHLLSSGAVSVRTVPVAAVGNNTYYQQPYANDYYRYDPYGNSFNNSAYCDGNNSYYDYYYFGAPYNDTCPNTAANSYYDYGYPRTVRYDDPGSVYVPVGYYGPWN